MLVSDIFADAREVLGLCSETKTFSRMSDAVEVLSNKGQWDSLLTYINIATTNDFYIQLPPDVDAVLRININGNPTFTRDRMWEFTLDGPGSNDARLGFQWEDQGDVLNTPVHTTDNTTQDAQGINQQEGESPDTVPIPPSVTPGGGYGEVFPVFVLITSHDTQGGFVIYTTDGSDPSPTNGQRGGHITRLTINSETTLKALVARRVGIRTFHWVLSPIVTEFYTDAPQSPPPLPPPVSRRQRVIRLSQKAVAVRALVRLLPKPITSQDDWIPLDSKMAILLMLKALESYRRGNPADFQLGQAQEEQALKFLAEEQKSRNIFSDLAQAMDKPPMIGYNYHANNVVIVSDIYDEASAISGGISKGNVFDAISEAIEVLANKGQWDGMTAYLDMVPSSDIIGLPRQVEIPVRININSKPSLPRSRMFEFSTNGPGTDLDEVNTLTWEDQGDGTLMVPLTIPSVISVGGANADAGKAVTVSGFDKFGSEVTQVYTIPATLGLQQSTSTVWSAITRIQKDATQGPVSVFANFALIAFLYPDQVESGFRIIKLNRKADAIKIMFRKSSIKVSSVNDIIPLKSRSAILLMLRALQIYKTPQLAPELVAVAQQLEAQALKYLQEEEDSRLSYIKESSKDMLPAMGSVSSSRGVVIAGDVYDDAGDIFGTIGRQRLFDKITESMEMLANKSQWDGLDGYVDILTDQRGYLTLPRKVEIPIGMNFNRGHSQMRNRWFEFHMNGLSVNESWASSSWENGQHFGLIGGNYWDDLGEYPIIVEPSQALHLFVTTNQSQDLGINVRAYGYDNAGTWIRSNENGNFVDGELVPVNMVPSTATQTIQIQSTISEFRQISRISKDPSVMPIELFATGNLIIPVPNSNPPITPVNPQFLAIYDAEETEPSFRRFRIPKWVTWVRMRYRTSTYKITKLSDPLNMKSKTALVTMMRSLKALQDGQLDASAGFEAKAVQLISEEQQSRNPSETFDLQFDQSTCFADPLQGRY